MTTGTDAGTLAAMIAAAERELRIAVLLSSTDPRTPLRERVREVARIRRAADELENLLLLEAE